MSTARIPSYPRTPSPLEPYRRLPRWAKLGAWVGAGLVALILIVVVCVLILLHSARFHNYVLATVDQKASQAVGTQVRLQNFALNLSNLSLDVYGITVHGAAPYPDPPLLQVAHARVGVRIVSILRQKWYLDTVILDQPVVKIFADAHGVTNIPTVKSTGSSSSNTSVFDLGVRHAVLDKGAVYYNNRQSVLSADLRNLDFRSGFDPAQQKYSAISVTLTATCNRVRSAAAAQPASGIRRNAEHLPSHERYPDQ